MYSNKTVTPRSARPRRAAGLLAALLCLTAPVAGAVVSCTVSSLTTANFNIYNPLAAGALLSTATATINCTSTRNGGETANVSITASAGTGSVGSPNPFSPRKMIGPGTSRLEYYLYIDSNRTQIFGTGANGTFADTGSANVSASNPLTFTQTIYGRILPGQDVEVGGYGDTLIYTVSF